MAMRALHSTTSAGIGRRHLLRAAVTSLALVSLGRARLAAADQAPAFRVIAHPSRPERVVDRSFLADAFLKKVTRWANGELIRPVDLRPQAVARERFTARVLKRSVGAVRSYWQQRIFSGRDLPPPELDSDDAVLAFVAKSPGAVGYVSGSVKLHGVSELAIQ
jgi:hypothetical protein